MTSCPQSHYVTIVSAQRDTEIYQHGKDDCESCLACMADKHAAISEMFRSKLAATTAPGTTGSRALCHECADVVDVVHGKLSPHHGSSGEGCPLNHVDAQIYLPPRIANLIEDLCVPFGYQPLRKKAPKPRKRKHGTSKIRPTTKRTMRGLGGRRIVLEGFGRHAPAFIAITAGNTTPIGAWLSPPELRRLVEAARKILR